MPLSRRSFLTGLIAAPAIVRATSLMPVRALLPDPPLYSVNIGLDGKIFPIHLVHPGAGYFNAGPGYICTLGDLEAFRPRGIAKCSPEWWNTHPAVERVRALRLPTTLYSLKEDT